jgi:hypothetical protein
VPALRVYSCSAFNKNAVNASTSLCFRSRLGIKVVGFTAFGSVNHWRKYSAVSGRLGSGGGVCAIAAPAPIYPIERLPGTAEWTWHLEQPLATNSVRPSVTGCISLAWSGGAGIA